MKRLSRRSLYTKDQGFEVRIEQLERRISTGPAHWAVASMSGGQDVGSGGHVFTWDHFWTASPLVFSTTTLGSSVPNNEPGDEEILVSAPGIILASGYATFESGAFYRTITVNAPTDGISNVADITSSEARGVDSEDSESQTLAVSDEQWFALDESEHVPGGFNLQANVFGGVDKEATSASLGLVLIPSNGGERQLPWRIY